MTKSPKPMSAEHWQLRAQEARGNAAAIRDLEARRLMLEVAATYDQLVRKAEKDGAA
jgi:hypothetical protein